MSQTPLLERLGILADAAKYDASCASSGTAKRSSKGGKGIGSTEGMGICHAYLLEHGTELWITTHPSYLLPLQDDVRAVEEKRFADDLRTLAGRLAESDA